MNITATEVQLRLENYHLTAVFPIHWVVQDWLDGAYAMVCAHIVAGLRQDELALAQMADDGCPNG